MEKLQKQLNNANATIKAQNLHIQQLESLPGNYFDSSQETASSKLVPPSQRHSGGKIWGRKNMTSPAASARYLGDTIAFKNKRHNTVTFNTRNRRNNLESDDSSAPRTPRISPSNVVPAEELQGFGENEVQYEHAHNNMRAHIA